MSIVFSALLFSVCSSAQSNTDIYKVTSPIQTLGTEIGKNVSNDAEPYETGLIRPDQAKGILTALNADTSNYNNSPAALE